MANGAPRSGSTNRGLSDYTPRYSVTVCGVADVETWLDAGERCFRIP